MHDFSNMSQRGVALSVNVQDPSFHFRCLQAFRCLFLATLCIRADKRLLCLCWLRS